MPANFSRRLARLPTPKVDSYQVCRFVPEGDLDQFFPRDYLFTSSFAARFNLDGVQAFYTSEDAATAGAEWDRRAAQLPSRAAHRNQVLYSITGQVATLDLHDSLTLAALKLTAGDLSAPWGFAPKPTATQLLGEAVAKQTRFAAIRFPSDAARARGFLGFNLVIFQAAVVAPSSAVFRDDHGVEIQRWPAL